MCGSTVLTQSAMFASGDSGDPLGLKLSVSGSTSGSSDSGTAMGVSEPGEGIQAQNASI